MPNKYKAELQVRSQKSTPQQNSTPLERESLQQEDKLGALQRVVSSGTKNLQSHDILTLQSTVGNKAVQRLLKQQNAGKASIQRLMTKEQLIGLAGEAKEDKKILFFTKKMSTLYKDVLTSLDFYDQEVAEKVQISNGQDRALNLQHRLENLVDSCDRYIREHGGKREPRLQYIQQLKVSANAEIGELQELANSIPNYAGQTFREALVSQRTGKRQAAVNLTVTQTLTDMDTTFIPTQLKSQLTKQKETLEKQKPESERRPMDALKTEAGIEANALYGNKDDLKDRTSTEFKAQLGTASNSDGGRDGGTNYAQAFRGNSLSTALLSAYAFKTGKNYFKTTVLPTLNKALMHEGSLEIEPDKAGPQDDVQQNLTQLRSMYVELMSAFTGDGAIGNVPTEIKQMAYTIYNEATTKKEASPDDAMQMVAGFMFLRFINPIITQLASKFDGSSNKRTLVLLSKVLQNQANNLRFGSKEQFLVPFNDLLDQYSGGLGDFLQGVISQGAPKYAML